jgi:hypothetical protein
MDKNPKLGFIINPYTRRQVKIGGPVYRKLVADGIIKPDNVKVVDVRRQQKVAAKPADGFVINPRTGRAIKKGAALYKQLIREGIVFHDHDLQVKISPKKQKPNKSKSRDTCINKETFVMFTDVAEIPDDDFLMLPSGYCFAVSELIDWIKSSGFTNKNPHVNTDTLFTEKDTKLLKKYPELVRILSAFFKKKQAERSSNAEVLQNHLDVLYKIGDTGRICYFDQLQSFEDQDSAAFEYSIHKISELSQLLESLPASVKTVFYKLQSAGLTTLQSLIKSANEGQMCIHGVGLSLLNIFVTNFIVLEKYMHQTDPSFRYEPLRCNLYFVIDGDRIVFYNTENRMIINTNSYYYMGFKSVFEPIDSYSNTTMVWSMSTIKSDGLSQEFRDTCKNDLISVGKKTEWSDIEEWRKIKLSGYCFDLLFLINTVTEQLNNKESSKASPLYPSNPFTMEPFKMIDLIDLKRRIVNNYITVSDCLTKFLYNPELFWSEDEHYTSSSEWRHKVIKEFSKEMHFIKSGVWVNKIDTVKPANYEYYVKPFTSNNLDDIQQRLKTIK